MRSSLGLVLLSCFVASSLTRDLPKQNLSITPGCESVTPDDHTQVRRFGSYYWSLIPSLYPYVNASCDFEPEQIPAHLFSFLIFGFANVLPSSFFLLSFVHYIPFYFAF